MRAQWSLRVAAVSALVVERAQFSIIGSFLDTTNSGNYCL